MSILVHEKRKIIVKEPRAIDLKFSKDRMKIELEDGRIIDVPLEWFPRLRDARTEELEDWQLIGDGIGIHWNKLDEDISVEKLLL